VDTSSLRQPPQLATDPHRRCRPTARSGAS
jgi:hypothetical protein